MSVRRILNKTSQKKRDTLLTWSNVDPSNPDPDNDTYTPSGATIPGGTGAFQYMMFCPTARGLESFTGSLGSKANTTIRTSTTVFARGYKEITQLRTRSGKGWQWRRICFTLKGDSLNEGNSDPASSPVFRETSNGYQRLIKIADPDRVSTLLFRGNNGQDWNDPTMASLDTRRVSVKYDRLRMIRSGNDDGVVRTYKQWFPMNKNIYYEDDESGSTMNTNPFSVESNQGMGDYYIVDIFRANPDTTAEDSLDFECNGTYFWHEK
ncbi:capsid protein [Gemycircularvirus HV-GcV2]|uniref:Capsid protein n=1 Tax=Gemycircularvirus HV-GcV2 TaxID=1862825 RepID=A0A193CE78_9VIRU|nr:capsid protein [Gemycircularvirus HV-GcV2]ANN22658.1 capsid protein [Gemycircularvirus HV-GcV2]